MLDFVFVKLVSLNSDIILKLNEGFDKSLKGSNLYPYRTIGIFDVKEVTAGIMKCGINMEHPSGMIIKASGGLTV